MADQHKGNMILELMGVVDKNLAMPQPEVEIGRKIVVVIDGVKVSVGPEVIEWFKRIEAEKRAAIASGKPYTMGKAYTGVRLGDDEQAKANAKMRALVAAAGFPGLFD